MNTIGEELFVIFLTFSANPRILIFDDSTSSVDVKLNMRYSRLFRNF
jgi:ABC-type multidrug transport system fused ATPase/permease subunit